MSDMAAANKSFKNRATFMRDEQLAGLTYAEAAEKWRTIEEIADTFEHDGVRTADEVSELDIRDAIDDYQAMRRLGL